MFMDKIAVATKLQDLQAQITFFKRAVIRNPDFEIDEKNWARIQPTAKKIRKALYKERYGKK